MKKILFAYHRFYVRAVQQFPDYCNIISNEITINNAFQRLFLLVIVLAIALTSYGGDEEQSKSDPAVEKGDKSIPADWTSLITHKIGGKVFEMKVPPTWQIDWAVDSHCFRVTDKVSSQKGMTVGISATAYEKKDLANYGWKPDGSCKPIDIMTNYVKKNFASANYQPDGELFGEKAISCTTGPVHKTYYTMTPEFTSISLWYDANPYGKGPDALQKMSTMAERIISSISIVDTSKMSANEIKRKIPRFYTSPTVIISRRRNYYEEMNLEMLLPAGWSAKVTTARAANGSNEKGLFVIEMLMPFEVEEDQAIPRLIIVMEGLKIGPLSKDDFLNTLDPHIKSLLPEAKLLNTKEIIFYGTSTLALSKTRWSTPTGSTIVRTYSGQDAYDRALKIQAYTAGGITMACHIILVADSKTYDTILPEVNKALNPLKIHFYPFR